MMLGAGISECPGLCAMCQGHYAWGQWTSYLRMRNVVAAKMRPEVLQATSSHIGCSVNLLWLGFCSFAPEVLLSYLSQTL